MKTEAQRKLVTKIQLAQRYTVSKRTIENWMKDGLLPYIKIGRKFVRFDPDESDVAIARFKVNIID